MSDKTEWVSQVVRDALKAIRPDAVAVDGSADLARQLGLDSVQVMDLVMEIEDHLDVSVPVELLADARTLDQLCAGIVRLVGGAPREPV